MIRRSLSAEESVRRIRVVRARTTGMRGRALRGALAPMALTAILGCQQTQERADGGQIAAEVQDATELADAGSADAPAGGATTEGPEPQAPGADQAPTGGMTPPEPTGEPAPAAPPAPAAAPTPAAAPAPAAAPTPAAAPAPAAPAPAPAPAPAAAPEPTTAQSDTPPGGGNEAASGQGGGEPSLVASPTVYDGWKQFAANCERCHGQDALGSSFGPDLRHSVSVGSVAGGGPLTKERFVDTVKNGRLPKGMPAWGPVLTDEQISDIHAYVTERASGQLLPGRPTREGS